MSKFDAPSHAFDIGHEHFMLAVKYWMPLGQNLLQQKFRESLESKFNELKKIHLVYQLFEAECKFFDCRQ